MSPNKILHRYLHVYTSAATVIVCRYLLLFVENIKRRSSDQKQIIRTFVTSICNFKEFEESSFYTQSGKGRQDLKKLLLLGPPKSNNLGNFLQHMQKSESFNDVFWRNLDLKFFPYKTSRDKKARFTK